MSRTTEQWEALLDGTTPGPWTVVETAYRRAICRIRDDSQSGWAIALTLDHDQPDLDEANAELVAAAPDAVAEVIRLRKAMEAVRDDYRRNADAERWLSQFSAAPMETIFDDLVDALTRILEGESNE